ncbi:MAG: hypothetical protein M1819_005279 [Sarea resinae]|nr:MAG: hypothetical protein M1819_005279 [Sarea resinae]
MMGSSKTLINLLRGWPNPALLPVSRIRPAAEAALSDPSVSTPGLLYGPDPGYEPLREQVAQWLTSFYDTREPILAERICITGGASQNLACLLQVFTDPIYTRNVWMVAPTYFLACRIFEDSGFHGKLRAVPEDEQGINLEILKDGLEKSEEKAQLQGNVKPTLKPPRPWSKIYRHIIYAVPTFSNPSSTTMSLNRRQELVRLARRYDALIVTDDVYDCLQWSTSPGNGQAPLRKAVEPRIVDVDRYLDGGAERPGSDGFGNAVSNGSFSKIVGPGFRTGWAEGTEKMAHGVSQTGSSRSGGAPSQLSATFVAELLKSGDLNTHIETSLLPAYASRYRKMSAAIEKHLSPLGVRSAQPGREVVGGYFIWLELPDYLSADNVAARAKDVENLIVAQGSLFEVYGDEAAATFPRSIRVCFSWENEDRLTESIERLARVIEDMQSNGDDDQKQQASSDPLGEVYR